MKTRLPKPGLPALLSGTGLALALTFGIWASAASAVTLPKGAEVLSETAVRAGEVLVATGPWTSNGGLPAVRVAGQVSVQSWRLTDPGLTTLALITGLRADLSQEGYAPGFACHAEDCGGFDFRFAIPVLPEPQMHVDLGDFRYLVTSRAAPRGQDYLLVLVSRGPGTLYVQITTIVQGDGASGPPAKRGSTQPDPEGPNIAPLQDPEVDAVQTDPTLPPAPGTVVEALVQNGGVALDDLAFAPGAAALTQGDYASLQDLGAWLLADAERSVVLVGHTDASGGLAGNVELSKRRAASVRDWLLQQFDLKAGQISAEGVGYLAPRARNDTDEGRAKNRRVEVMLTPTR